MGSVVTFVGIRQTKIALNFLPRILFILSWEEGFVKLKQKIEIEAVEFLISSGSFWMILQTPWCAMQYFTVGSIIVGFRLLGTRETCLLC